MGILNGPRINFWGGISTNVCTANNSQPRKDFLDLVNPSMKSDIDDKGVVEIFKEYEYNWNYYGDHQVRFRGVNISSQGEPGNIVEDGSLINEPVYILGSRPLDEKGQPTGEPLGSPVMVDLDPTDVKSTQIYIGGLQIGTSDKPKLLIHFDTVASSYDVGFKNISKNASGFTKLNGMFQVFFPKKSIVAWDKSDCFLNSIMSEPFEGIALRFCMFDMTPELTESDRLQRYKDNLSPASPAMGRVVGTLAPAYAGEPKSCPQGRLLKRNGVNDRFKPTGYAHLGDKLLTLDTLSLMLKNNFRDGAADINSEIEPNIDMGTLTLSAGGLKIAEYTDRPVDYYRYGGIVDIQIDDAGKYEKLQSHAIQITGKNGPYNLDVKEAPIRIYSESRNIYLDDKAKSFDLVLEIRELGEQLKKDISLSCSPGRSGSLPAPNLSKFKDEMPDCDLDPDSRDNDLPSLMIDPVPPCLSGNKPADKAKEIWDSLKAVYIPKFLGQPQAIEVKAGSEQATIKINLATECKETMPYRYAGLARYQIQASDASGVLADSSCFTNFRKYPSVLPASAPGADGKAVPAPVYGEKVSWEQVYAYALRFYYLVFPAMSKCIPLNDEGAVWNTRAQLLERTSDKYRNTTLYMPIVRSMTPVQVRLLHTYLKGAKWGDDLDKATLGQDKQPD